MTIDSDFPIVQLNEKTSLRSPEDGEISKNPLAVLSDVPRRIRVLFELSA